MQFNSIEFLFYFLPLFLAVYFVLPGRVRNVALIIGSFAFYAFSSNGNYWWIALLFACVVFTYLAGLTLSKPGRGHMLAFYLGLLAGVLIFFKLYQGGRFLPAGMSFYLFQMAAYLIDVYRLKFMPERNFLSFTGQTVMFPKLLSGPLVDPLQMHLQHKYCSPSFREFHDGLQELILGLGLKVILANRLGGLWSQAAVLGYDNVSVPFAWMALTAYAMQLYFDFYGYSMMAMGLGRMLGYELPRNFLDPYASRTVSEFYRRWHASLGEWFRNYMYIPLGGNRKGTFRTILNLAVVWLFTGLWHGVGGNYVLWAGFLFLLIVNERLWLGKVMNRSRVFSRIYLVFVILLSWVPFAIGDWNQMLIFLGRLFGITGSALNSQDFLIWGQSYVSLLIAGVVFATPLPGKLWEKIRHSTLADVLVVVLFWVVVYYIATAAQDPFLYFQY